MCTKISYTSVWYHCTMPGLHKLIFSVFRGSFSSSTLLPAAEHHHTVFNHTVHLGIRQRRPDAAAVALSEWSGGWFISTVVFPLWISKLRFCCKVPFANALNSRRKKQTLHPHNPLPPGLFWKAELMLFMENIKIWCCPICRWCRKRISFTCLVVTQTVHKCCADSDVLG